ncbi:MAG: MBL fold metallo-hydrolase [Chloroflexi bacterium]|nr:MBL fold metallo-hydrolase [Chloroflexota bacterium]
MILRYFYDERLAQASYLVGCAKTGEALIVDPARAVQTYMDAAEREGVRISHIAETHIHADYVSGGRGLAAATGALLIVSGEGGPDWQYAYVGEPGVVRVMNGDTFMVGNVSVEVLHTPGHTPEHIAFVITDTAAADRPMGIFTGDAVFVGDIGRPDLLEAAAGVVGSARCGGAPAVRNRAALQVAARLFAALARSRRRQRVRKALGAVPSTTLGYEKLFNPAFQIHDEDAFVAWLLDGQPEPPRYFAQMKQVNRDGPALLADLPEIQSLTRADIDALIEAGAFVVDVRDRDAFAAGHIPGTISTPATSSKVSTYVGSLYDFRVPVALIVPDDAVLDEVIPALRAVGVDRIAGVLWADGLGGDLDALPQMTARALADGLASGSTAVLDIRNLSEWQDRHVSGAQHVPLTELHRRAGEPAGVASIRGVLRQWISRSGGGELAARQRVQPRGAYGRT